MAVNYYSLYHHRQFTFRSFLFWVFWSSLNCTFHHTFHSLILQDLGYTFPNSIFNLLPLETPSFIRPLEDKTVTRGETAVLQCIAGGSPAPRLNWTKDDGPLLVTERHFFAAANQLLIIVDAGLEDAGKYTCLMSNTLGTERGHIYLNVISSPNCDSSQSSIGHEDDGWTTVGIVIIVVVCCVVGTSLIWVIVIYHMRRKNEDYSITNTGKWYPDDTWHVLKNVGFSKT